MNKSYKLTQEIIPVCSNGTNLEGRNANITIFKTTK
jgi:hypothetical protein